MITISNRAKPTIAVIDVGTNSTKLLIVRGFPGEDTFTTESFQLETTRIGEGLESSGLISNNAQVRIINTLERFRQKIQQFECDGVYAFSTHVLRNAQNAETVVKRIKNETGVQIKTLTGDEEARYAYLSALPLITAAKPFTYLIDVGGGSTEFVCAKGGEVILTTSLPLGALHLTERFITTDPVSAGELKALCAKVSSVVSKLFRAGTTRDIPPGQVDLVASGGSATTVKEMLWASTARVRTAIVSGAVTKVRVGDIRRLQKLCASLPLSKRKRLPGLDPARADIILAGLVIATAFMDAAKKRVLRINAGGVREGAALHIIQNNLQW
jgi:exopolyphosphatase/guanosine-5'-triphosphate,3'-diphosphate pyrophosphatase